MVEIPDNMNVAGLKNTMNIKQGNQCTFAPVDIQDLVLWKVSIPANATGFNEQLQNLNLAEEKQLESVNKLSLIFPDQINSDKIHIIVKPPPSSESSSYMYV